MIQDEEAKEKLEPLDRDPGMNSDGSCTAIPRSAFTQSHRPGDQDSPGAVSNFSVEGKLG